MKNNNCKNIYQFKIVLENTKPTIWRRIQAPENYTFWDLHVAIQSAMGWADCHLHQFETMELKPSSIKYIGIPDEEGYMEVAAGWEEKISDWFFLDNRKAMRYVYDFGDSWNHKITLEKILPKEEKIKYPVCVAGANACPLEDCGGVGGYYDMLEIINDPKHKEYKDTMEWLGNEKIDPEEFDIAEIEFEDPRGRLKDMRKQR